MVEHLLVLETSTSHGSVAVLEKGEVLFEESFAAGRSHSALLFEVLGRALERSPRPGAIAVGLGPGSYAGVRIAICAAVGLSLARGAELWGLSSLAALAPGDYIALGDARRESFYFAAVREGEGVLDGGPHLFDAAQLEAMLAREPWAGWPRYLPEPQAAFPEVEARRPDAVRLGRLALSGRGIVQRNDLEPIYLREPTITQAKAPRI